MKITNKTLGWGFFGAAWLAAVYLCVQYWFYGLYINSASFALILLGAHIFVGVSFVTMVLNLINDDVEFEIIIPLPFANYIKLMETKRELNKAIADKYRAMALAEGSKFDRLHDEAMVLEKQLEKLEK